MKLECSSFAQCWRYTSCVTTIFSGEGVRPVKILSKSLRVSGLIMFTVCPCILIKVQMANNDSGCTKWAKYLIQKKCTRCMYMKWGWVVGEWVDAQSSWERGEAEGEAAANCHRDEDYQTSTQWQSVNATLILSSLLIITWWWWGWSYLHLLQKLPPGLIMSVWR